MEAPGASQDGGDAGSEAGSSDRTSAATMHGSTGAEDKQSIKSFKDIKLCIGEGVWWCGCGWVGGGRGWRGGGATSRALRVSRTSSPAWVGGGRRPACQRVCAHIVCVEKVAVLDGWVGGRLGACVYFWLGVARQRRWTAVGAVPGTGAFVCCCSSSHTAHPPTHPPPCLRCPCPCPSPQGAWT